MACEQWSSGSGSAMMQFERIDGLTVAGNYAEYKAVHDDPARSVAVRAVDCTAVSVPCGDEPRANRFPITKFRTRAYTGADATVLEGATP